MKKLVFMFVAFAAISFASCGGNTNANAEGGDTTVTDTPSVVESADTTNQEGAADTTGTAADTTGTTEVAPEA